MLKFWNSTLFYARHSSYRFYLISSFLFYLIVFTSSHCLHSTQRFYLSHLSQQLISLILFNVFISRFYIAFSYHVFISRFHITFSYHVFISRFHITFSYHVFISRFHITFSYHVFISRFHITFSYHVFISCLHIKHRCQKQPGQLDNIVISVVKCLDDKNIPQMSSYLCVWLALIRYSFVTSVFFEKVCIVLDVSIQWSWVHLFWLHLFIDFDQWAYVWLSLLSCVFFIRLRMWSSEWLLLIAKYASAVES